MLTTSTKNLPATSFGVASLKSSTSQGTCNICKRLLYSFEEILLCRVCQGSYHWRCVKPETISHYGENAQFVCNKCDDGPAPARTASPSQRLSNAGIRIKSPDSMGTDYRDFASVPSKLSATPTKDTTVVNAIRYFEEKQQFPLPASYRASKATDSDGHYSSSTNGQYTDDSKIIRQIQPTPQQQQYPRVINSDDDSATTGMFQANYQYTPLKDYAAMKNGRTTSDTVTNGYQNSSSPNADRQFSSHYNGGSQYSTSEYDPTKSRVVDPPTSSSTKFTSPTVDNITVHNRQQNFTSTTNLNVNETSSYRQQQNDYRNPLNRSTPYLSQVRTTDSSIFKPPLQSSDHHSTVGSDSGIVMVNSTHQQHQSIDEDPVIERKLSDIVQKLGRQFENDTQKLSDKLELKLKNLEHMINQQTFIIRRQDEVIENLKSKMLKIETERDQYRDQLSFHEQRKPNDKTYVTTTTTQAVDRKTIEYDEQTQQQTLNDTSTQRKTSSASSGVTEQNKPSSKKTTAPRVDHKGPVVSNENEFPVSKLVKAIPNNQERPVTTTSTPTGVAALVAAVPLTEKPAATSRLNNIIHQSNRTNDETNSEQPYYNLAEIRHPNLKQYAEPFPVEQQLTTSIHHSDVHAETRSNRSASSHSTTASSSSTPSASVHAHGSGLTPANNTALAARNSNLHRSLESIPRRTSQTESGSKLANKTTSLEFGTRLQSGEDDTSIYVTPKPTNHPATAYQNVVKGWLRKQNRVSFFKRIERYYCVLSNNTILMHKHDTDTTAQKVINLQGAKVHLYEDQKHGPSLELTWSTRFNDPKQYHLYMTDPQEAQQWLTGIQAAIQNANNKPR